jgi:hypothetical protein
LTVNSRCSCLCKMGITLIACFFCSGAMKYRQKYGK